jgi:uncharacterized protein YbaP (TraB family)
MILRVVLAAFLTVLGSAALAKPPVWTVTHHRATVILFGSIHLLPAGLDWRPAQLASALAKADLLYFELPLDQATDEQAAALFAGRGMLRADDSLSAHLPPALNERLRRTALELGVSTAALDRMRPWFAEVTLSVLDDLRAGGQVSEGVERQIQALAPSRARRKAFESPRDQIDSLADTPEPDQIASLDETLTEIEGRPTIFRRLVGEWMNGDLAGLQTDALQPLEVASPTSYRRLITERNRRWSEVIRRLLTHRGTTVVVVGIGHLLGPEGLPALLRNSGFAVAGP